MASRRHLRWPTSPMMQKLEDDQVNSIDPTRREPACGRQDSDPGVSQPRSVKLSSSFLQEFPGSRYEPAFQWLRCSTGLFCP